MRQVIELRASNAHRWMVCAGQPQAVAGLIDDSSAAADRGTVAHALLEIGLRLGFRAADLYRYEDKPLMQKIEGRRADHILVDEAMIAGVSLALEYVHAYLLEHPKADYEAECQVDASGFVGKPSGGTSDIILHDLPRELVIIDYKNGVQHVDHVDNNQLRIYGLGALDRYSDQVSTKTKIRTVIIQPNSSDRGSGTIREEIYTYQDLLKFSELAAQKAKEAYSKNPLRVPGEHCNYCRAAGACKAYTEKALHQAALDFALITEEDPTLQEAQNLDNEELARLLKALPMLKRWIDSLQEEAVRRMVHGQEIPEYQIIQSSPHRRWTDSDAVIKYVKKYTPHLVDYLTPREPLTPARMEKLLPKLAPENSSLLRRLQGSITRNPVEPRLAPQGEGKPFNVGEEFNDG